MLPVEPCKNKPTFKKKSDIRRGSLSRCALKSNRMPSRPVFLLVFFLSYLGHILAQDPLFSQFYASPLQLNPAMAGVAEAPRISLNYRNQWPSWPNAYSTYALGFEQALNSLNSGFGISVLADDAGNGIYRTLTLHAVYSYSVQLGDDFFAKFGMEGGVLQTRVDWDRLVFGDQLNPYTGATLPGGGVAPSEENCQAACSAWLPTSVQGWYCTTARAMWASPCATSTARTRISWNLKTTSGWAALCAYRFTRAGISGLQRATI